MIGRLRPRTDLRTLITLLAVASIVITLANALYATWRVQRAELIENTLENNRVYAAKLASTTELFFQLAQSQLRFSANTIGKDFDDDALLQSEVDRLREQTSSFNSVAVIDANGFVRAISPESLTLKGMHLDSHSSHAALTARAPMIGKPSISAANNLIVFISTPIWSRDGRYLGYVGGTLYLKKKSILNSLLGEQYYRDDTSLYVVDSDNQVLYHQDGKRVGQTIAPLVDDKTLEANKNGALEIDHLDNASMLAGYARVPTAGWLIVALKPTLTTLQPLTGLLFNVLRHSVPFVLLTLLASMVLARLIASPLWQLARRAGQMEEPGVSEEIGAIRSWYFEAAQIKRAMRTGILSMQDKIGRLRSEVQSDPLTGLLNRRGLSSVLDYLLATQQPFAILAMDIDHFKRINDNWGHDVGDRVIQQVAIELNNASRQTDVVCRNGGEEFLMILPGAQLEMARTIAERVRQSIFQSSIEQVGQISISIGVSFWQPGDGAFGPIFKQADDALYQAKHAGRNRVVIAGTVAEPLL